MAVYDISLRGTAGSSRQEKAPVLTHVTYVTVGHICQVISSADGNHIPHMVSVIHGSHHGVTGYIPGKCSHIAQVHKSFGIALADYVGAVVAVKNINQLPRVVVCAEMAVVCRSMIIRNQIADLIFVKDQFFIIRCRCIVIDQLLSVGSGCGGRFGFCGIHRIVVGSIIVICYGESQTNLQHCAAVDDGRFTAVHLVIPVHFIGKVSKKCVDHSTKRRITYHRFGKDNVGIHRINRTVVLNLLTDTQDGRCALTTGELSDQRNQRIIQQFLVTAQPLPCRSSKNSDIFSVKKLLHIPVIQLIILRQTGIRSHFHTGLCPFLFWCICCTLPGGCVCLHRGHTKEHCNTQKY